MTMQVASNEEKAAREHAAIEKANTDIQAVVSTCSIIALRDKPALIKTIQLAQGLERLRRVLHESAVKAYFMPLKGTTLGFLTDEKPNEPYGWEVVRDCVIEALLRGFQPIGNEFNIIAGRFYGAKNGFERIVREYPGLRDLKYELAVPALAGEKGALVAFRASWHVQGEPDELVGMPPASGTDFDGRIPVKVNAGMGPDAILGKATRKLFARIYNRINGTTVVDSESEPGDAMPPAALPAVAEPSQDGKRMSLGAKPAKNGTTAPATEPTTQRQPGED